MYKDLVQCFIACLMHPMFNHSYATCATHILLFQSSSVHLSEITAHHEHETNPHGKGYCLGHRHFLPYHVLSKIVFRHVKKGKIIKMFNLMLNHTSVDLNCNGYVPQTEKNISFEARYRANNCLIFVHTEVFKAYILYLKHCHCISLLIYLRQFDFEVYHYCNHW